MNTNDSLRNQTNQDDEIARADASIDRFLRIVVYVSMISLMIALAIRGNDRKREYRSVENKIKARQSELVTEMDSREANYASRGKDIFNTMLTADSIITNTDFKSERDRRAAKAALRFSYAKQRIDLNTAHKHEMDSLRRLYNRTQQQLDSAYCRIYGTPRQK